MASGQANQLMKPLRKMKSKRISHGDVSSVGPHSVPATSLSDLAGLTTLHGPVGCRRRWILRSQVAFLGPRLNRSDRRGLSQRAVAIPTLGWRLRVESCPTDLFGNSLRLSTSATQRTVAATEGGGRRVRASLPKPTLNTRAFRLF